MPNANIATWNETDATLPEMLEKGCHCPVAAPMALIMTTMTAVRIRVARSEPMPATPILAKIAVNAAKAAESTAQKIRTPRPAAP